MIQAVFLVDAMSLKPYRLRLLLTVVLLNLLVILLAATSAFYGYRQYQERADVSTRNLARLLESDLINAIRQVDVSLLALRDIHRIHYREHVRNPAIMTAHMEMIRARLPDVDAIRMTDVRGVLMAGTGVEPETRIDLSDRPHFIHLRESGKDELVFAPPQISRVNNKWVVVLARMMPDPEGNFDGMVFAAIPITALVRGGARLELGAHGLIALRDQQLGLIARYPPGEDPAGYIGQQAVAPQMQEMIAQGLEEGSYYSQGGPNYDAHRVTFRKLEGLPLYVTVGLSPLDYLAPWRQEVAKLAAIALLFLLASAGAAHLQYYSWRLREKDSEALVCQEALYRELVEDLPMLVVRYQPDTRIIFANRAYGDLVGVPVQQLPGRKRLEFIPEESEQQALLARIAALTPEHPGAVHEEHRVLAKDGKVRWTQWTDRAYFDAQGRLSYLQSVGEDITEQKRNRDVRAARMRLMEFSINHSMDELLVATLDEVCTLTESPIGFYHYLEADQHTVTLQAWSTRTARDYCKAEGEGRHYDLDAAGVWADAIRQRQPVIHNDYAALANKQGLPAGHAQLIREMVVPVFRKGLIVAILGVGNKASHYTEDDVQTVALLADLAWDFADAKRLETQLVEMATTDFLTGLNNRRQFMTLLNRELERLRRLEAHRVAVLMLDLDNFKRVNDTYGHAAGDEVLQQFARLMRSELRKVDTVGRLGGEEFAILLLDADLEAAEQFAERLRRKVAEMSIVHAGQVISIRVSIGISLLQPEDASGDAALIRADAALYEAKRQGRNRVCVWRP